MTQQLVHRNKLFAPRRTSDLIGETVGAFESETAAVFLRTAPGNEHIILYVLAGMLAVFIVLSVTVKLDKVVSSVGRIVTSAGSIYVSPFDTGIVRQIYVKSGQVVKKGQTLATLDPTFTNADVIQLQQKLLSDEAVVAREESELAGRPFEFSRTDMYASIQRGIWNKRHAEYISNLANFDGQINSAEAQVGQYKADLAKYANRLQLASDTEKVYKPLLEKGYVSKLQLMQASDAQAEMSRLYAEAQSHVSEYQQTLASLKAQREAFVQKWHSDTGAQLVMDRNDLDKTRQNLDKAQKLSDLTTLNAPDDAVVLRIGKVSSGSVASGGGMQNQSQEPLFTLVPLNAPVEADINISADDIGFIRVGDPVQLKLDAYRFMQHGSVRGTIKSISEGSFTTDDNNTPVDPYFKLHATITEARLRNVPTDFRLVPGMTLKGDIMVGRRTILSYLVEGAVRTGSEAMREP